jgi:hypothetical protein
MRAALRFLLALPAPKRQLVVTTIVEAVMSDVVSREFTAATLRQIQAEDAMRPACRPDFR